MVLEAVGKFNDARQAPVVGEGLVADGHERRGKHQLS